MKTWWLNISYDEKTDEFFADVDDGDATTVFQIDDTNAMCELIFTGVMNHIDDVSGLTRHLIRQNFIGACDIIKVNPELRF
jgi:hypothetical protein